MELVLSRQFSWIAFTQVGDALANGQKGFIHRLTSDRFAGLAGLSVTVGKYEHVGQLVVLVGDIMEGGVNGLLLAEGVPLAKDFVLAFAIFDGSGCGGDLQRRA